MNGSSEHRGTVPFPYRAVLSDIDGTLLDADRRVSERTARAVRTLTGNGIVFALVTGRMPSGIVEIRTALGGPVHAVCYSGALVLGPDNAVLASTKLQRCEALDPLLAPQGVPAVRAMLFQRF